MSFDFRNKMKIWIVFFLICCGWHLVQPDSPPNASTTSNFFYPHQTCSSIKISPKQDDNAKAMAEKKEADPSSEPDPSNQSVDNITSMAGQMELPGPEPTDEGAPEDEPAEQFPHSDFTVFYEELAKNVSDFLEEKKFGKIFDDCSHRIFGLYNKTLNRCGKMFNEFANLASRHCKDILAQSEKYFFEASRFATRIYNETVANCGRLYNDCSLAILELYEEPGYNFRKLIVDYSDMTLAFYNETVFKLKRVFNIYSDVVLKFFNEAKLKLNNQYEMALQQISLTYCIDCVFDSPLFYNLTAALALIHVHRRGLNVITLTYLILKFFMKSKLLVSAYKQFFQPLHSASVAVSKTVFTDNQMPNDQIYWCFLILYLIVSIILTIFSEQKTRLFITKVFTISTLVIYVKSIYLDVQYSSVSTFNLDDLKYTNTCLNINHLESDILLIFMAIVCFCDKSEKIAATSKSDLKVGRIIQFIGGQCVRLILYFIMLASILPAHIFIVSKSFNAQPDFWPYKPSVVCEINVIAENQLQI